MALMPRTTYSRNFANKVVTAPAAEPVTLAEAKDHMRITDNDSDSFIHSLIIEARQMLEQISGIAFITQTWKLTIDHWPGYSDPWWNGVRQGYIGDLQGGHAVVPLPRYPLQEIDSITVYDEDSNPTSVVVADVFDVDVESLRGRLVLKTGATWPVALRRSNAIQINYTSGYGDSPTDVPEALKRAIRVMVAYMFKHRGTCGASRAYRESGAKEILTLYKDIRI